jgi:hypothetical protein
MSKMSERHAQRSLQCMHDLEELLEDKGFEHLNRYLSYISEGEKPEENMTGEELQCAKITLELMVGMMDLYRS